MAPAPRPFTSNQSRDAMVAAIIAADPEMQAVAREFVHAGLVEMLHQLKRGDAQTRAQIARSMSGVVANLFTQQQGDDGLEGLRIEMQQMMGEMRSEIGAHEDRDSDETPSAEELIDQARGIVPKG